jgi:hypothetical protein
MGKSHDFTNIHWGQEFALDVPLENVQGIATGQNALKSGDHIILCVRCRVDEVEYYSNESDLWQARISFEKPISLETITENKPLQPIQQLITRFRNFLGRARQPLSQPTDSPLQESAQTTAITRLTPTRLI